MKHTRETFAAYKKAATIGNNLPLPVKFQGLKRQVTSTSQRCGLEEASIFRKTPKSVANIERTQAKIWGGR